MKISMPKDKGRVGYKRIAVDTRIKLETVEGVFMITEGKNTVTIRCPNGVLVIQPEASNCIRIEEK